MKKAAVGLIVLVFLASWLYGNGIEVQTIGRWGYKKCNAAALSGNLLYLGQANEMAILDASDPVQLKKLGSISLPSDVLSIFVSGDRA